MCWLHPAVAPSQPAAPPTPLPSPEFPFQMISLDYFYYCNSAYFVIIDRYSKWISIYTAKNESSKELIAVLKSYFSTFGISSECATDGGPQFVSGEFQAFLKQYKVHHRLASASLESLL